MGWGGIQNVTISGISRKGRGKPKKPPEIRPPPAPFESLARRRVAPLTEASKTYDEPRQTAIFPVRRFAPGELLRRFIIFTGRVIIVLPPRNDGYTLQRSPIGRVYTGRSLSLSLHLYDAPRPLFSFSTPHRAGRWR